MLIKKHEYLDYMLFKEFERPIFVELFGPLVGLSEEWISQGAKKEEIDMTAFDWDYVPFTPCGANALIHGQIDQPRIIEENDQYVVSIDQLGRTNKMVKKSSTLSIPLTYPVNNMDDWRKVKHVFEYHPDRVNVNTIKNATLVQKEYVITADIFGAFNVIRMLMGEENCCIAFYTQPELIQDILTTVTDTTIKVFEKVLNIINIDQVQIHEDMAGKSGPMVGPKQIREFFKPYYSKVWDLFSSKGTKIFQVDSDGDINDIIDPLLECGINSIYPMEPAAGMDIVEVRKKYGNKLTMAGGIDKHVLRESKEDIRNELEYKMQPLMQQGGMIFGLDHRIPNGTPLENYRYYVDLGRELLGIGLRKSENKGWQRMAFCGPSIL
jgi:uroporphyrinogen-III decarboxylase